MRHWLSAGFLMLGLCACQASASAPEASTGAVTYYSFGLRVGRGTWQYRPAADGATFRDSLDVNVFNHPRQSCTLELNAAWQITGGRLRGSTLPWLDAKTAQRAFPAGAALEQACPDPLSVGRQWLLVQRFRAGRAGQQPVQVLGRSQPPGPGAPLTCYALGGLTWDRVLLWLTDSGAVAASVTPLVAATLTAVSDEYQAQRGFFEGEYVRLTTQQLAADLARFELKERLVEIRNVRVWDGRADSLQTNMTLVVGQGRLRYLGRGASGLRADTIVDGRGHTVLPGLFDMHAHLKQTEWLPAYLAAGVTTVRDLGSSFELISAYKEASRAHGVLPRLFRAGFIDGAAARPYAAYQANTPAQADSLVQRYYQAGFDQIKVWNNVPAPAYHRVIQAAHARGLRVTGHVPAAVTLRQALTSGQNEINHLSFITEAIDRSELTAAQVLDQLTERRIALDPTLVVMEIGGRWRGRSLAEIEPGYAQAPAAVQRVWAGLGRDTEASAREGAAQLRRAQQLVKQAFDRRLTVLAGSDQGIPGHTLHRELELYVAAGVSPRQAIQAATAGPARYLGIKDYGLQVGQPADFILVRGNPFERIGDLRNVVCTVKGEALLPADKLWQAAGFAPWRSPKK